ncbi:hypothetical protein Sjap_010128 [Stephania japonica]|uniref:Isopenicillin N synthase-like Fe(2+) 2OG dioxygenase domain-containing protein n=1 Tax=Stephania japonica TaxID=461633 RepID=A0AAP0P6U8_9MAGN
MWLMLWQFVLAVAPTVSLLQLQLATQFQGTWRLNLSDARLVGNRFHDQFKDQTSIIRLNHYPLCPAPELALGIGRHKDPESLIVNVGDIIQVWSNGKYESVEHRVMANSERERFSFPFFFTPGFHVMVKPVEELVGEHSSVKYREYSWGQFFKSRTGSNYKNLGVANRQISDYEIHI